MGDMRAQAASLQLGALRYVELASRYGAPAVQEAGNYLLEHGERITRAELAKLPAGVYEAEDSVDDDGQGNGPIQIKVRVTITADEFVADFTGTDPQTVGAINCTMPSLVAGVAVVMKAITDPEIPVNDGCFRPMRVVCPPGTVLTAQRPAPTSVYFESADIAMDVVWRALAQAVPERLGAGHFLSVCGTKLATSAPNRPDDLALLIEPQPGGWGATQDADGENGIFCAGDGETYVVPVEVAEAKYNLVVEQFALNIDDHGAGRTRGGRGCIREYRALGPTTFGSSFGRHSDTPWGIDGGRPGSSNRAEIRYQDGRVEAYGKSAGIKLQAGDVMRLVTGTGAGWGDPFERPVEKILSDVREGYVTREQAENDYGVVPTADATKVARLTGRRQSAAIVGEQS
jgi:N-methylhydantoinase B